LRLAVVAGVDEIALLRALGEHDREPVHAIREERLALNLVLRDTGTGQGRDGYAGKKSENAQRAVHRHGDTSLGRRFKWRNSTGTIQTFRPEVDAVWIVPRSQSGASLG
jgi:hypothetical protein